MPNVNDPTHPYLDEIEPYEPPDLQGVAAHSGLKVEQLIRLDSNENPFGPSPAALHALATYPDYGFYPDYRPLRQAVARYAGVAPEQVVLSNGADEVIDLVTRLFVEPGQAVLTCPPTFSMYHFYAQVNRCQTLPIPRREDFSTDVTTIEAAVQQSAGNARLLFLVSPGNPDGLPIPLDVTRRLLKLPLMVAVDEAYIEFGGESAAQLLQAPENDNLIVIRTFSKWAGMAGLRLGYALLTPRMAGYAERMRAPYNVNAASLAAALATLDDLETVRATIDQLIAERERLRASLAAMGWLEPLPCQANFVLCRLKARNGRQIANALARQGILIRTFSDPRMADYIRISVGLPRHNDALLAALRGLGGN